MTQTLMSWARRVSAILLCGLLTTSVWAERVSVEDAALVANNFMHSTSAKAGVKKAAKPMVLKKAAAATESQYYVYENANGEGWVMVAANDVVAPILAYSNTGRFVMENQPSNLKNWLGKYDKFIGRLEAENVEASEETAAQWKALRKGVKAKGDAVVGPLIKTQWDQDTPYWNLCPGTGDDKAYTGCVATAMAQVMNYWQWPKQGIGSHTYQPLDPNTEKKSSRYGELTVDFSATTYDWEHMKDKYTGSYTDQEATAVATLIYHCGVATEMMYGNDADGGSGTYTLNYGDWTWGTTVANGGGCAQNALWYFFGYRKAGLTGYMRDGYTYQGTKYYDKWTDADWTAMVKAELDKQHPIMYAGAGSGGGHSFICDGYDDAGYFHFNWGWSGSNDGYYKLSSLVPGGGGAGGGSYDFTEDQEVLIGIQPDKDPVAVTGVSVAPTSLTLKIKERGQVTATVVPDSATIQTVTWTSSNAAVATVSASGVVTGVAAGEATITATTSDGGFTATCAVTVLNEEMPTTELIVDGGYAVYSSQDKLWTVIVYDSQLETPWLQLYIESGSAKKIAGSYDLADEGAYLWLDPNDEDTYEVSVSGHLTIECIGNNSGSNGCNIYSVVADFVSNEGNEYSLKASLELCGYDTNQKPIDLEDAVPYEVTWMCFGAEWAKNESVDGKLVLPTDQPESCEEKVFVGWCQDGKYNSDTAPTLAKNGDPVNAAMTFYAVFAKAEKQGGDPTEVANVTFKSADSDSNKDGSDDIAGKLVETSSGIASYSGSKLYVGREGMKMGSSKANGSITLTLTADVEVNTVKINASRYGSDNDHLIVLAGETQMGEPQSPESGLVFSVSPAVATNTITVETTSKRAYVASISVIAGGTVTYSEYTSTCGTSEAIDNTVAERSAEKVLRNGQVLIIRNGHIYNIAGQVVE